MNSATFDRFDIKSAHYLFWSEHHQGMFSEGYTKLCKALSNFSPSPLFRWESLSDNAKDIYRNLCDRLEAYYDAHVDKDSAYYKPIVRIWKTTGKVVLVGLILFVS